MASAARRRKFKAVCFNSADVIYALGNAAEFLESSEFPDGTGCQEAANLKAAQVIRRVMAARQRHPCRTYTIKVPVKAGVYG